MNKKKSAFVTAIVFSMLAVITFAAYRLSTATFIIINSVLSIVGFETLATFFFRWLENDANSEEEIEPPEVSRGTARTFSDEFTNDFTGDCEKEWGDNL